ncbi:Dirigent protein 19 [Linum grandiflorum]
MKKEKISHFKFYWHDIYSAPSPTVVPIIQPPPSSAATTGTIMGRNPVFNKVREMPIIGGSGLFRFARGYAHASTHNFNLTSGDACVEYNLYVLHY